jgi:threonine/homoserine/homoserine lactone efflux protein
MEVFSTFVIAFFFSFVGTIPPGTLNLTIIRLGLDHQINIAWRMAFGAALIEYPYAWIAIEFQEYMARSSPAIHHLKLSTALVMICFGVFNLWSAARPSELSQKRGTNGFRAGLLLGLLNPLAVPFWMAMTAYNQSQGWIDLSTNIEIHAYLLGVSLGTLTLVMLLAYLARMVVSQLKTNAFLRKAPGVILIMLGFYSLFKYMLE